MREVGLDRFVLIVREDIEEYNRKLDKNPLAHPLALRADKIVGHLTLRADGTGWYSLECGERLIGYGDLGEINIAVQTLLRLQETQIELQETFLKFQETLLKMQEIQRSE